MRLQLSACAGRPARVSFPPPWKQLARRSDTRDEEVPRLRGQIAALVAAAQHEGLCFSETAYGLYVVQYVLCPVTGVDAPCG